MSNILSAVSSPAFALGPTTQGGNKTPAVSSSEKKRTLTSASVAPNISQGQVTPRSPLSSTSDNIPRDKSSSSKKKKNSNLSHTQEIPKKTQQIPNGSYSP